MFTTSFSLLLFLFSFPLLNIFRQSRFCDFILYPSLSDITLLSTETNGVYSYCSLYNFLCYVVCTLCYPYVAPPLPVRLCPWHNTKQFCNTSTYIIPNHEDYLAASTIPITQFSSGFLLFCYRRNYSPVACSLF